MPSTNEWMLVWGGAALGFVIGLAIHSLTHGNPDFVFGMGAAGAAAAFLVIAGANLDAGGWRGASIALAGSMMAFVMTSALHLG